MSNYRIIESVGNRIEPVHGYSDLEIHHPSHHGHQPGRHYAEVDGRREEVLKAPTSAGHLMVSKDFILTDANGSTHVPVPSPAAGYVGKVDPRNGLVCIYDHKGGELIAQVRHMDLHGAAIHEGQSVAYGQPLGIQGGYGGGNAHAYGIHTHIDFNVARLDDFKRYFADLERGSIAMGHAPQAAPGAAGHAHATAPHRADQGAGGRRPHGRGTDASVVHAQECLAHLGYTGADGRAIAVDRVAGRNTEHGVRQVQQDHRLPVTGRLDGATRESLAVAERTMASSTHPAHALFQQSLAAVQELDRRMGIPSGAHTLALAGVTTAEAARAGLTRVDRVEIANDRIHAQAVQFTAGVDDWLTNRTSGPIDVARAVAQPIEVSTQQAGQAMHGRAAMHGPLAQEQAPMRAPVM